MLKEGLSEKVTFEQKLEYKKRETCDYLIEGSTNSKCKGPVAGAGLTGSGNGTDLCIQTLIQKAASEHLLNATLLARSCGCEMAQSLPSCRGGGHRGMVDAPQSI